MPHEIAAPIQAVSTSTAGLVGEAGQGPTDQAVLVTSLSEYHQTFGGPQPGQELFLGVGQFFTNGGQRAWVVRLGSRRPRGIERGLAALNAAEDIRLLCLPGLAGGRTLAAGAAYARARRAFFVGDPAGSRAATLEAMQAIRRADAGHAAVYVPRLRVPDPLLPSATRLCGPAASVAGVLARTDRERGVWTVAAGTGARLQGAVGLASAVDDRAAATLRGRGVNTIREVPGHGIVLWGARTVGGGGESGEVWKYVPIRRLALFIAESVSRGTEWVVFEPNDEPTWTVVRRTVEPFLDQLFRQGAFAGQTPQDSFFVRCGADTMTQTDIDRGVLVVEVGVAPLRPAEFVIIRIRLGTP
jgi:Bacteriophage tail sheath protein